MLVWIVNGVHSDETEQSHRGARTAVTTRQPGHGRRACSMAGRPARWHARTPDAMLTTVPHPASGVPGAGQDVSGQGRGAGHYGPLDMVHYGQLMPRTADYPCGERGFARNCQLGHVVHRCWAWTVLLNLARTVLIGPRFSTSSTDRTPWQHCHFCQLCPIPTDTLVPSVWHVWDNQALGAVRRGHQAS